VPENLRTLLERLESQAQRHLNLSGASNGLIRDAETAEAGTRVQSGEGLTARRRGEDVEGLV
jgi:hypothetical protein